MKPRHERYPFLREAREAVAQADVDLADLVARDADSVQRGRRRVERALVEGTAAADTDEYLNIKTELLSYPIARVLVSLLDAPGAVEKYAAAEADTAHERFVAELDGQRTLTDDAVTLPELLREFDLQRAVREEGEGFAVAVGTYLTYAPDAPEWALVRRELADGWVPVSREELLSLLREAVEARVRAGLPLDVPEVIAEPLEGHVRELRSTLASVEYPRHIGRVEPDCFPPCIDALVARARADEDLDRFERFALVAFLAYLDMTPQDIRDFCGQHGEAFTYTTERLGGDGGMYPPPSFATLRAHGICDHEDEAHERTGHPLAYYAARLEQKDAGVDAGVTG